VSKPSFAVQVADLERGPKSVEWTIPSAWLRAALEGTEAVPRADGVVSVELSKDGAKVMVRGHARAALTMPCARTLEPVDVDVAPEIFLLLSPLAPQGLETPTKRTRPHDRPGDRTRTDRLEKGRKRPVGARDRVASGRRPQPAWHDDPELGHKDAATDSYSGDSVVLDDFLREFILLELPMFPVRQDLPSRDEPAIRPPRSDAGEDRPIDPRLMPLAAIASRLRQNKE
jgi:uncharacterized protein